MDLMELGALGELVGGLAVIGSLLYVGLQVRQGNHQHRAESTRDLMMAYNGVLGELADASFAELFRHASLDYGALSRTDQTRVSSFLERTWRISYANHLIDPGARHPLSSLVDNTFAVVINAPGFAQWWTHFKAAAHGVGGSEYVERIDALRAAPGLPTVYELGPWYEPAPDERPDAGAGS